MISPYVTRFKLIVLTDSGIEKMEWRRVVTRQSLPYAQFINVCWNTITSGYSEPGPRGARINFGEFADFMTGPYEVTCIIISESGSKLLGIKESVEGDTWPVL